MVILDLVLKARWYDLIQCGQKKCEYREIKNYWTQRLFKKTYTHVRFRKGYTKENMIFEIISIEKTKDENDLAVDQVYKINIGARIK